MRFCCGELDELIVDVSETAQLSLGNEFLKRHKCRVVSEEVAHHEHPPCALGCVDHSFGIRDVKGERLLDEDVFPGVKRVDRQLCVRRRRCGHHDCVDIRISE